MLMRRVLFWEMWVAVVAAPAWLLVGWVAFSRSGWGLAGAIVAAPVALLSLAIVSALVSARGSVRSSRAIAWKDAAILLPWHAAIVGLGVFGDAAWGFLLLAIVLGIAAFWLSLWWMLREAAARARAVLDEYQRMAAPPQRMAPEERGEMIVIEQGRDDTPR